MDKPQVQVIRNNEQSYRYLRYPIKRQMLHLLYPGRLMEPSWSPDGSNIPHEDMHGWIERRNMENLYDTLSNLEEEAEERRLGGKGKIPANLSAPEPELPIEHTELANVNIESPPDVSSENVSSKLDHLNKTMDNIYEAVNEYRQQNPSFPKKRENFTLSANSNQSIPSDDTPHPNIRYYYNTPGMKVGYNQPSPKIGWYILMTAILALMLVALGYIIYKLYKSE